MHTFLVALKDGGDADPEDIMGRLDKDRFPETYSFMNKAVWFVAAKSPTATAADISEQLAPDSDDVDAWPVFVVLKLREYHGVADTSLWDKLEAWARTSNG